MKFKELNIGNIFSTKTSKYIKISDYTAKSIVDGYHSFGDMVQFHGDFDVVLLHTAIPNIDHLEKFIDWLREHKEGIKKFVEGLTNYEPSELSLKEKAQEILDSHFKNSTKNEIIRVARTLIQMVDEKN